MNADLLSRVKGIIEKVDKQRLYRGKGGEIMREGVCHLIYSMSLAKINFSKEERVYLFRQLQENFKHPNPEIQEEATKAFHAFCAAYEIERDETIVGELRVMFKASHTDENVAITRGYNMCFGVLSK